MYSRAVFLAQHPPVLRHMYGHEDGRQHIHTHGTCGRRTGRYGVAGPSAGHRCDTMVTFEGRDAPFSGGGETRRVSSLTNATSIHVLTNPLTRRVCWTRWRTAGLVRCSRRGRWWGGARAVAELGCGRHDTPRFMRHTRPRAHRDQRVRTLLPRVAPAGCSDVLACPAAMPSWMLHAAPSPSSNTSLWPTTSPR